MEAKANHLSRPALSCSGEKYTRSELKIKPNLFWSLSSTLDVFNTEILATHYLVLSNIQAANIATLANFIFPVILSFFFFGSSVCQTYAGPRYATFESFCASLPKSSTVKYMVKVSSLNRKTKNNKICKRMMRTVKIPWQLRKATPERSRRQSHEKSPGPSQTSQTLQAILGNRIAKDVPFIEVPVSAHCVPAGR